MDQVVKLIGSVKTGIFNVLELMGVEIKKDDKEIKTRHDPELVKHLD